MKKTFMLSLANIRKTKGNTVSLILMFLIASILLNVGLLVTVNFGSYFQRMVKELNASTVYYAMPSNLYTPEVENYIKKNSNIVKTQKEDAMWMQASIPYKKNKRELYLLFNDADHKREMSRWKFIGQHLTPDAMSVYVPYVFSIDGGYQLNDKLAITFDNTELLFTIKGFTDDVLFSSLDSGLLGIYMPHKTFETVKQQLGNKYDATVIFANLKENNKKAETGIRQLLKNDNNLSASITSSLFSMDLPLISLSRTMTTSIVALMVVLFAAIIVFVCLVVVRFRIVNSVEEDMPKIGSLKAIGYTSKQIIFSVVTQFIIIAGTASLMGIALSYLTTPTLSEIFAHQSGLKWVQGFDPVISSMSLLGILLIVALVSFIASKRIQKLSPIVALRGGLTTHSFRRNHVPLDKSLGSLPMVLALKSILQSIKQSLMIAFILVAVSFCSTFAVVIYYNTEVDTTAFSKIPGVEISNVIAVFQPGINSSSIVDGIKNMYGVQKEQFIDESAVKIDDNDCRMYVMDDYSTRETNTIYEGRYPLHQNEVALSGMLATMLHKNIRDAVTLQIGENKAEYIVTGLTQGTSMGGMNASIRHDGILRINPNFKQQSLNIYLNKGTSSAEFISKLKNLYGNSIVQTIDIDKELKNGLGSYTSIVSKIGCMMLATMIIVVILVLYFVINSSIIRKKRELGIQKAVGFTTLQLMNQVTIGFLPPIVVGMITGIILGIIGTNPLMTLAERSMGIMKASFIIDFTWISIFGIAIAVISYVTSMLITSRIRKISAYTLISE